jgi:Trypsin-co-occurring domain 1
MDDDQAVTEVEVTLDGARLYIEAVSADGGGEEKVSSQVVESLQTALDSIKAIGVRVAETARAIEPDRFSVQLGFTFKLEQGVLVAMLVKGSGTASLTVNLEWDRLARQGASKGDQHGPA